MGGEGRWPWERTLITRCRGISCGRSWPSAGPTMACRCGGLEGVASRSLRSTPPSRRPSRSARFGRWPIGAARADRASARAGDRSRTCVRDEVVAMVRERIDQQTVIHTRARQVVATSWRHTTARTVEGQPPDPQLHSHVLLHAAIRRDGKVVAIDSRSWLVHRREVGAAYRTELARELAQLGFADRAGNGPRGALLRNAGRAARAHRPLVLPSLAGKQAIEAGRDRRELLQRRSRRAARPREATERLGASRRQPADAAGGAPHGGIHAARRNVSRPPPTSTGTGLRSPSGWASVIANAERIRRCSQRPQPLPRQS